MNTIDWAVWRSFVQMKNNFLGDTKASSHVTPVNRMVMIFHNFECLMSISMHFLFSHMEKFPENLGTVSDDQEDKFHQEMHQMEERYQGWWVVVMLVVYCWSLRKDIPAAVTH